MSLRMGYGMSLDYKDDQHALIADQIQISQVSWSAKKLTFRPNS